MTNNDLIRRSDAIDLLKKWSDGYDYIETETESAIKEFCNLPSVRSERKDIGSMSKYTQLTAVVWYTSCQVVRVRNVEL